MTEDEAENFISLLEMKNVWELSQLANILKVKISEFQIFAESLPRSYGLSISEDKLMITQNILNDISNHLMERFTSWSNEKIQKQNREEDKNSFSFEDITISDKESPSKFSEKRVKIAVYGDNTLSKPVLSSFCSEDILKEDFDYAGGYHPLYTDISIEREQVSTQFLLIDYERNASSIADLLFDLSHGFLFILGDNKKKQLTNARLMIEDLLERRKKELFVNIVAIFQNKVITDSEGNVKLLNPSDLDIYIQSIEELVKLLKTNENFNVSYSIASITQQAEKSIVDLVQTSKILTFLG